MNQGADAPRVQVPWQGRASRALHQRLLGIYWGFAEWLLGLCVGIIVGDSYLKILGSIPSFPAKRQLEKPLL